LHRAAPIARACSIAWPRMPRGRALDQQSVPLARAAVTADGGVGPWSGFGTFQSPRFVIPTASSNNDEWKTWFFAIIDLRGVGPTASAAALKALIPDVNVAGVILETNSAQEPRGRLYLPTGNPNNLYGRSVDIGDFGKAWQWLPRGGTVCEGGNCPK